MLTWHPSAQQWVVAHNLMRSTHNITLYYIALHYTTLHYITLHYTALHYTAGGGRSQPDALHARGCALVTLRLEPSTASHDTRLVALRLEPSTATAVATLACTTPRWRCGLVEPSTATAVATLACTTPAPSAA